MKSKGQLIYYREMWLWFQNTHPIRHPGLGIIPCFIFGTRLLEDIFVQIECLLDAVKIRGVYLANSLTGQSYLASSEQIFALQGKKLVFRFLWLKSVATA